MIKKFLSIAALSALSSLLVTGCGGGGSSSSDNDAAQVALASRQTAATATVQLEGCVVDSQWMSAPATAVHVRRADGRVVGTAFTNRRGVFVMTVPARTDIVLDTAVAGPGEMAFNTGSVSFSASACLLADL